MIKNVRGLKFILSFLVGSLAAFSMAPLSAWYVLFPCLSVFFVLLSRADKKVDAFAIGWLFAFGYFLFGLSWIGQAVLVEGNGYRWVYPLAVAGIPFLLAMFWGLGGLVFYAAHKVIEKIYALPAFVLIFSIVELARGYLFTGFPWNLMGYSWVDVETIRDVVAVISIYGLTSLTFLWCTLPGYLWLNRNLKSCVAVAAVIISMLGAYFYVPTPSAQDKKMLGVNVKLVPGHVAQADKWDREQMYDHFLAYIAESYPDGVEDAERPTLIVWPETAITDWFYKDKGLRTHFKQMLQSYDEAVLLTGVLRQDESGHYNSLVMIDADGKVSNVYDKSHLVPFGEYIPFQKWLPFQSVTGFSGFKAGQGAEVFETPFSMRYAAGICYEIIFPHSLLLAKQPKPDFIVNVTNDAWYEGSAGPAQHGVQVIFRAIEYGVPIIRVSNKGESFVVNSAGHITQSVAIE